MGHVKGAKHLIRTEIYTKNDKPSEFIFNPTKKLPRVTSSKILRWAIIFMAFDFDIMFIKGNTIPHVDAFSRQEFDYEKVENHKNAEDKILHWVETVIFPLNWLKIETRQSSVLSKILERITRNIWNNCLMAETLKKTRHHWERHNIQWRHNSTFINLRKDI